MKNKSLTAALIIVVNLICISSAIAKNIQHNIRVDGITCPFCVASSAKELKTIDGVVNVDADISKGIIKVCADESVEFTEQSLTKLFIDKGFTYKGKHTLDNCEAN